MAQEFRLPELGEGIESGDVVSVLVKEGDSVAEDQAVLELETDKATVEVPCGVGGKVAQIHVAEGDSVKVGQLILTLEGKEEGKEGKGKEEKKEKKEEKEQEDSEDKEERERKEGGRPVGKGEEKAEAKSARKGGEVVDFRDRVREETPSSKAVPASPAVRRFAREIGMDIARISGSGPKGRISVDDVKAHSRQVRERPGPAGPPAELPDFSQFGEIERESFGSVRRATARHLAKAWAHVVHVTNHDRADVTRLEELRRRYAPRVEAAGGKLTVTAIALKVAEAALRVFPKFNASIDMENQEIIYKRYFHIGVAVDTERGLLVPVIRDVDQKNLIELSLELTEIAERARKGKIGPDDLRGGCFTITNLGGIGGTSFTPIVNFPEVAILGLSRTSVEAVYGEGRFEPRKILPLSLSYDHRLVDGADAARFLRWIAQALEDPFLVMLG